MLDWADGEQIYRAAGGGSWLGGGDTAIRLWRVSDGRLLHELAGHKDTVKKIAFSPGGDLLASCCLKAVHLWRTSDGKRLRTLEGDRGNGGTDLVFSADGSKLACWIEIVPIEFDIQRKLMYNPSSCINSVVWWPKRASIKGFNEF